MQLNEKDIRTDVYSSGINCSVIVSLTHLPTGCRVYVVRERSRYLELALETIQNNMHDYEFICDRPHADGDFSYLCGGSWCRCQQ